LICARQMRPPLIPAIALLSILSACDQSSSPPSPVSEPVVTAPAKPPTPTSPWTFSRSKNQLSGEETVTAVDGYGDVGIVVRRVGKKLELYVKTGKFLETVENLHTGRSPVKYKFDDGAIVRQEWDLSENNNSLFYPGNPMAFIQKLRKAKRFVIEYQPSETIPETLSLDVSLFPHEMAGSLGLNGGGISK